MEKEPGRWRALERTKAKARKTQGMTKTPEEETPNRKETEQPNPPPRNTHDKAAGAAKGKRQGS